MGLYGNVKILCEKKHMSVLALEDKVGFPRSSICKWDTNIPGIAKVKAVADVLGVSVDSLIEGVDFPDKEQKEESA